MENYQFQTHRGQGAGTARCQKPTICPVCNNGMEPKPVKHIVSNGEHKSCFICGYDSCGAIFIVTYDKSYNIISYNPQSFDKKEFNSIIADISSNFCDIYNQAEMAEHYSLAHIAGPGYRKAFEFLIKDYIIKDNQDEQEKIIKMPLSGCISTYITSENIKNIAEKATWLGNDETHYKRVWENKDITDLKKTIEITTYWIIQDEETKQILEEMKPKQK